MFFQIPARTPRLSVRSWDQCFEEGFNSLRMEKSNHRSDLNVNWDLSISEIWHGFKLDDLLIKGQCVRCDFSAGVKDGYACCEAKIKLKLDHSFILTHRI